MDFNKILLKFNKTAFYFAVEKENMKIIKLLLQNNNLNVNIPYILIHFLLIMFKLYLQIAFNNLNFNIILNYFQ